MKTIYLEIFYSKEKKHQKVINNHFWFDIDEKELKTFSGGSLKFKYDINDNKMKPYVEDLDILTYENKSNKEKILSWISSNKDFVSINAEYSNSQNIAIDVEDENELTVIDMIERVGFRYGN